MCMYPHRGGEEDGYVSSRGEEDQYNMRFEINKVGRREEEEWRGRVGG